MRSTSPILAFAFCAMLGAAVSAADPAPVETPATRSDLPAVVLTALEQSAGTKEFSAIKQIVGADGKKSFAATFTRDGRKSVATVGDDGTVISVVDAK